MKLRRFLSVLLALVITGGIVLFAYTRTDTRRGAVTLWYAEDCVLAEELKELVHAYNSDMTRETLPVEITAFKNEQELASAYETATPDILLCSHDRAFSLYNREKLTDVWEEMTVVPQYPKTLQSRSPSIGRSFYPIGISVPVLVINDQLVSKSEFTSLESFLETAVDYTEKTGKPYYTCSSLAQMFNIYLLRFSTEFDADFDNENSSNLYTKLYNDIADTAFAGALAFLGEDGVKYVAEGALPCAVTMSEKLRSIDMSKLSIRDIPAAQDAQNSDTVGVAYGLAVTNGGSRSKADIAAFISWLFSEKRDQELAEKNMLAPAVLVSEAKGNNAEVIETVNGKLVSLPTPDSEYMLNKAEFDEKMQAELEKLLPYVNAEKK